MTTAADMLQLYIAAEKAVLSGQTYQFGDRRWTLADLDQIRAGRKEWEAKATAEAAGSAGRPSLAPVYLEF